MQKGGEMKSGVPGQKQGPETEEQVRKNYLVALAVALGVDHATVIKRTDRLIDRAQELTMLWKKIDEKSENTISKENAQDITKLGREFSAESPRNERLNLYNLGYCVLALLNEDPRSDFFTRKIQEKLVDWHVGSEALKKFDEAVKFKQ